MSYHLASYYPGSPVTRFFRAGRSLRRGIAETEDFRGRAFEAHLGKTRPRIVAEECECNESIRQI